MPMRVLCPCLMFIVLTGNVTAETNLQRVPLAEDDSLRGAKAGDERLVGGIQLCWCPAGEFTMGSPVNETGRRWDETQMKVVLSKGYWIGKFEVTQGQWQQVVGEFPDKRPSSTWGLGDAFPVYWVNFIEAEVFCEKLTAALHKSGELPKNWEFRLPTESQWEYACRAGTTTATSFGNVLGHHQANFSGDPLNGGAKGLTLNRASPIGSYAANAWGLHDMHGNIFEWCRDWYHTKLPGGRDPDLRDVRGVQNRDGSFSRVRRGGAWNDDAWACRSAMRLRYEPERRSDHIGFRVVLVEK